MSQKLESLDADFKLHHYAVVDALDDEGTLAKEQETLDQHDDDIAGLAVRIEQLIATSDLASESGTRKIALRRLSCVKSNLSAIRSAISELTGDPAETHLLHHYQEQLSDFKKELGDIRHSLLSLGLKEGDELEVSATTLDKEIFDSGLQVKKLLFTPHARPPPEPSVESPGSMGVKLPKLDVPTFDGNILNWQTFWEQFCVAVHDRSSLSDAVYLRHALKDGSAKKVIEGLSRSGEHYIEAIECLRSRYNRPRIIHQTHVRRIMEIAPIKEGSGKELRYLHDVAQQHLRAMGHDPADSFITSLLELKLDQNTMFEWQRFSQESTSVPPYKDLLNFINLRAQASESTASETKKVSQPPHRKPPSGRSVASFAASASNPQSNCILCENERHPLYVCPHFKSLPRDKMISTIRDNELYMNCLRRGHFSKQCKSLNKCRKCQKPHHTLIHSDKKENTDQSTPIVSSNTAAGVMSNTLLMTCQVIVKSPDGSSIRARALLDSASSTSFVSERLAQNLCLPRTRQDVHISGIAGLSHHSPLQSVATFNVSSTYSPSKSFNITAVVIPRVTCDLPIKPIYFDSRWTHLSDLSLADPDFGRPGTIDILLGVDVYADVLLQGRRCGPSGTPVAFETQFGWVLAGRTGSHVYSHLSVTSHHVSVTSGDDLLRKFWEIEENPKSQSSLSVEERSVVEHFNKNHTRTESGRFIVPLPKRPESKPLSESRSQAVRRFMSLERSLHLKNQFQEFSAVVEEYFEMDHAELVPVVDLQKPPDKVFYLPMHAVRKEHSTTTKLRVVFDASAKSATGVSLNDLLLVGPTVHPPLVDILLRFRSHRVALTADVSKMYRAVELTPPDRDLHRFVWRKSPDEPLRDYRMTRVTFGVSASSFAANMSMKQNALDFATEFPQAVKAVEDSFYVDDSLTGADSVHDAIKLQKQLQSLFLKGGFLLRKWNSSESAVLKHISSDLKDSQSMQLMPDEDQYTKTLGIEWNARQDHFRLTVADLPPITNITKRALVSDLAKTFDVLGWFSPTIIKVKILLQRLWERKVEWDDPVPSSIKDAWLQWRSELPLLTSKHIPRCYFDKKSHIVSTEIHGFCDASEQAYAAVIYFRMVDSSGTVQTSLVISKTKVAPIKRLTIPRLELCGAHLLAQLLYHVQQIFQLPLSCIYAWTDSTIVLSWLIGSLQRFKTYVGNRVSYIVDLIGPERWNHVNGLENPADCASRGLFPSKLIEHSLWWNGPTWFKSPPTNWPKQYSILTSDDSLEEEREITLHLVSQIKSPVIPLNQFSNFNRLKRTTAWILRFIDNCRPNAQRHLTSLLSADELFKAEYYWISVIQDTHFKEEIQILQKQSQVPSSSTLQSNLRL